jgi:hypothetical protein
MLSMLAYFYFHNGHGPSPKQAAEIRKWFWATSVGSRYSGRDFNRCVPDDLRFFKGLASSSSGRFSYVPQAEPIDIRRAQYAARTATTSAVYCLLLARGPVYLLGKGLNEIPIDRYSTPANRKDRHHIFPRGIFAGSQIPAKLYNSVANICLLVAEENQRIRAQRPRVYFDAIHKPGFHFRRKMDRHLIDVSDDSGIWDKNWRRGFKNFLERRSHEICDALEDSAGIRLFRR